MPDHWDGIARALSKASPEFMEKFYEGFTGRRLHPTTDRQETTMDITSGFHAHDPSGDITTRSVAPDVSRANPYPAWVKTGWDAVGGVDRHTTILTEVDAISINTHEIPALIEKLQAHLVTIEQKGGIPR